MVKKIFLSLVIIIGLALIASYYLGAKINDYPDDISRKEESRQETIIFERPPFLKNN